MTALNPGLATLQGLIDLADDPNALFAAMRPLWDAVADGDAHAAFLLGVLLFDGHVGRREVVEGLRLLRLAAGLGHPEALAVLRRVTEDPRDQHAIGHALVYGLGAPADPAAGLAWLRKSADQGRVGAQELLGRCLFDGVGCAADPAEAVRWFRAAAGQGDADAKWALAIAHRDGRGVDADPDAAMAWTRQAAEGGNVSAQYALALALRDGRGVARDPEDAARRMAELVELGHVSATEQLGLMYVDGLGVPHDPQRGIDLLVRAKRDRGFR